MAERTEPVAENCVVITSEKQRMERQGKANHAENDERREPQGVRHHSPDHLEEGTVRGQGRAFPKAFGDITPFGLETFVQGLLLLLLMHPSIGEWLAGSSINLTGERSAYWSRHQAGGCVLLVVGVNKLPGIKPKPLMPDDTAIIGNDSNYQAKEFRPVEETAEHMYDALSAGRYLRSGGDRPSTDRIVLHYCLPRLHR